MMVRIVGIDLALGVGDNPHRRTSRPGSPEMPDTYIEEPILNTPFREPDRHFRFDDDGITNEVEEGRRPSSYFVPIPQPKRKSKQLLLDAEWTRDRIEENETVNRIRQRVGLWRSGEYQGVTSTTRRLLRHWTAPERETRLFFCQVEALETVIYMTEAARSFGDTWVETWLREANDSSNPGLNRLAMKMATGTGKTVVMTMMIAWHALNKLANPKDRRFSDTFLIVTPGITIRDRLRVLLPSDPENYHRRFDLVPPDLMPQLGRARVLITNFHAFKARKLVEANKLTKEILGSDFDETPAQTVNRVCRELGTKRNIVVVNDEAHHCYRRKPEGEIESLKGEERVEAERRNEEARVWISGLEAVRDKLGVRAVYDLSATPFFLRGSGYREGMLFPWVVSDFSLIDAIEAGIVKIPRVPVADNMMRGDQPMYRSLWPRIREFLPRKGRKTEAIEGEPKLPVELQGALHSLYENYKERYGRWERSKAEGAGSETPPVFIVVCNNTNVSKLVSDYIAGWERTLPDGSTVLVPGQLPLFNNVKVGRWSARPVTILVDSEQLESGEAMSPEFKQIAAREIDEFKAEYRTRFPGRDAEQLTDEDLLREVMNTVGKPGKLGEGVRCVVSVSMLTEGWDAQTVTHILGVRAFGTQLLCEQVVGRALRRMSYAANHEGKFVPEYADIYGVPFQFIPCSDPGKDPKPGPKPTRVRAIPDRIDCEITWPRLVGYRYEVPGERLRAAFSTDSQLALTNADIPTKTEIEGIIGEGRIDSLDDVRRLRLNEVAFRLAKLTLEKYFRDDEGHDKPWLFPQVLAITKRWLAECLVCKGGTFPQLLWFARFAHDAADRIYKAIVASVEGMPALKPILRPYEAIGTTRHVDFFTIKETYPTRADKCHVSHVVGDSGWEFKMAQEIEDMGEVVSYVKNQSLGFSIPYTVDCVERQYIPDFLIRLDDGHGRDDLLNLIVEVTGERTKDKEAKVSTARTLWVPSVTNHGGLGRWGFVEILDPFDNCAEIIRGYALELSAKGGPGS
jgi:type III restriction enzyme